MVEIITTVLLVLAILTFAGVAALTVVRLYRDHD